MTARRPRSPAGSIPREVRRLSPLITPKGFRTLTRLQEHPHAPAFNYRTGDRLAKEDLAAVDRYREEIFGRRGPLAPGAPPEPLLERFERLRRLVPLYRARLPEGLDLARDWAEAPTTSRADLACAPWRFVPDDQPLERLVIYRTAGTTGHPISVPHHPVAIACYLPLIEFALSRHGATARFAAREAACFLVGCQVHTYTYAAVLSGWGGAGFAKLNLRRTEWKDEESPRRYFAEFEPPLLTGDPISFAEMLRLGLPAKPRALVTTSVALSPALKVRLAEAYDAPVIDWYSLVETGPLGYACPKGHGYHQLPRDVHLEALGADGRPVAPGRRGEITVTGGRNGFAPLLRYRTGDWGRLDYGKCPCGDASPRLLDLEGRVPVLLRSSDGTPVTTVDLSRCLREFPLLLHEFTQRSDLACELVARALPGRRLDPADIESALRRFLGSVPLEVRFDPELGDRTEGKAAPYRSELMVED